MKRLLSVVLLGVALTAGCAGHEPDLGHVRQVLTATGNPFADMGDASLAETATLSCNQLDPVAAVDRSVELRGRAVAWNADQADVTQLHALLRDEYCPA